MNAVRCDNQSSINIQEPVQWERGNIFREIRTLIEKRGDGSSSVFVFFSAVIEPGHDISF